MTYIKECSKSPPCAPGLCSEFYSCMQKEMHHEGRYSSQFDMSFVRTICDSYDIIDLHFVSQICLQFSFAFQI